MADTVAGAFAVTGSLLVLLAGVGVVRFRDVYARMHAATKASTLGIALIGIAGAVALSTGRSKLALAVVFTFITAPSAAHLVSRSAYRAEGIDIELDGGDDLADLVDELDPPDEPIG